MIDPIFEFEHNKSGGKYVVVTSDAFLQCSTEPEFEVKFGESRWTVYRNIETGAYYIRLTDEFNDGRFTQIG